jgi:hypothetical protein
MGATRSAAGGQGARGWWTPDERLHYRFPLLRLGLAVTLATEAEPALTIPGYLIDLSAGGCYLAAPRDLGLTPGSACCVGLPVTPDGLTTYPATVVRIERHGSAQPGVALGLCLRHHSPEAQRQLLWWLVTLRVQTWHASLHGEHDPTDPPDIWRNLAAADPAESPAGSMGMESESASQDNNPNASPTPIPEAGEPQEHVSPAALPLALVGPRPRLAFPASDMVGWHLS